MSIPSPLAGSFAACSLRSTDAVHLMLIPMISSQRASSGLPSLSRRATPSCTPSTCIWLSTASFQLLSKPWGAISRCRRALSSKTPFRRFISDSPFDLPPQSHDGYREEAPCESVRASGYAPWRWAYRTVTIPAPASASIASVRTTEADQA